MYSSFYTNLSLRIAHYKKKKKQVKAFLFFQRKNNNDKKPTLKEWAKHYKSAVTKLQIHFKFI